MRRVIVTADDFGISLPANEAIEEAHRRGILAAASLMVGGDAACDALRRARELPLLKVGLHLVLVCGRPLLPPATIPDLVDRRGNFREDLMRAGFAFFLRPGVRRQMAAEIRAQFEAFARTGLPLDHVNAHNHMHLHPTVFGLLLEIGRDYGMRAVRLPLEPFLPTWRACGDALFRRLLHRLFLAPLTARMKAMLKTEGLICNDAVFGILDSGRMDSGRLLRLLAHLPPGVSEIYFHPATRKWEGISAAARAYRMEEEFAALIDPAVAEALRAAAHPCAGFAGMAADEQRAAAGLL